MKQKKENLLSLEIEIIKLIIILNDTNPFQIDV